MVGAEDKPHDVTFLKIFNLATCEIKIVDTACFDPKHACSKILCRSWRGQRDFTVVLCFIWTVTWSLVEMTRGRTFRVYSIRSMIPRKETVFRLRSAVCCSRFAPPPLWNDELRPVILLLPNVKTASVLSSRHTLFLLLLLPTSER